MLASELRSQASFVTGVPHDITMVPLCPLGLMSVRETEKLILHPSILAKHITTEKKSDLYHRATELWVW